MPELPEVETVLRGLKPVLQDSTIINATITRPNLRYPFPLNLCDRLQGQKIIGLNRRAKYLVIDLDSGESLIIHLGMSGRVKINSHPQLHDHFILKLSNECQIRYHDPRRFGFIDLTSTTHINQYKFFLNLGPEPFSDRFNPQHLLQTSQKRNTPIKTFLLDQKVVAGLGNIYVCEALFLAKVNPFMAASKLTLSLTRSLVPIIQQVLHEAIQAGGSTLKDHHQPNGEMGYFQHQFKVYGREGAPCYICKMPIHRLHQSGRSTFYCPSCQV